MIKREKGITLIALVVTIVVLLILAVVSIAMLGGENGIITQAQNSKLETRAGEVEERVNLWKSEKISSKYTNSTVKTENELLEEMKTDKILFEEEIDRDNKLIKIGNREISYKIDGEVGEVTLEPDTGKEELILEYTVGAGDTIELPYYLEWYDYSTDQYNPATFDFQVDWGDGTVVTGINNSNIETDENSKHQYTNAGTYEIKIKGTYEALDNNYWDDINGETIYRLGYDKLTKVKQWGTTGLKNIVFLASTNLSEIVTPTEGSFKELTAVGFMECTSLKTIPDKLFANCLNIKSVMFDNCTSLTTIGDYVFVNCSNMQFVGFVGCTSLITIGDYAFANCSNMQFVGFGGCTSLITIGNYAFANCTNVESFGSCFRNCTSLTTIGNYAFANCSNVQSFDNCFYECENLKTIGNYAFYNCSNAQSFESCFEGCTNLTTIPENLFIGCTNIENFRECFDNCTSLTTIPDNLFIECRNAKYFGLCFYECTSLTSIPENLFIECTNAQSFAYCFEKCTSVTSIPENLFANCTKVESFFYTFKSCTSLTGNAIPLWERVENGSSNGYKGIPDGAGCYSGCEGLDDYNDIPSYWKTEVPA